MSAAPSSARAVRRRRVPLGRARIVGAALEVARSDGIEAVSMRRLADELESSPMSLYRHLTDRRELLLAMLDEVAAGIAVPSAVDEPRAEITALVTAVHRAFRRDPWVVQVLVVDGLASPVVLPLVERMIAALERAGLAGRGLAGAYGLLWHYVYGESMAAQNDRPDSVARRMAHAAGDEHPALARLVRDLPPADPRDFFAENLDRLLDGVLGP